MASGAFAQRTIDWAVDDIITPTQLNSSQTNQTPIAVDAVLKLVSGDSAFAGDTVGYQMVLRATNDQVIIAVPNGTLYARTLHKDMGVGDTMHLKFSLTLNIGLSNSADIKFQIYSTLVNRANMINTESGTSTLANNTGSKNIVWWNKQGWGVSVADVAITDLVEVYPNPATDEVSIDWMITSGSNDRNVKIYDINGRVVLEASATSDVFTQSLSLEGLESGMYMVEVSNGEYTSTQKLQVIK